MIDEALMVKSKNIAIKLCRKYGVREYDDAIQTAYLTALEFAECEDGFITTNVYYRVLDCILGEMGIVIREIEDVAETDTTEALAVRNDLIINLKMNVIEIDVLELKLLDYTQLEIANALELSESMVCKIMQELRNKLQRLL